jgi:hypothetical protein
MGLKDCLVSAVEQKAITKEEAAYLSDEFDSKFAQYRNGMSEDAAKATARKDLEIQLLAEAKEKRRRADLTEARRLGIKGYLQGYRDRAGKANVFEGAMALLSHYGFRGASSVRGRTEAIIAGAQKNLDQVMISFERKGLLGRRANRALEGDVVKELHGEASGDATAKQLARAVSSVFEDLRQRFNAAGGAIGKLEGFGLPHTHDRLKVKAAGRDAWKEAIRPLLDPARMKNPLTGQPIGAAGLEASLDHVYSTIVSQGRADMTPQAVRRGLGAVATQRQEERFLQFKDAAAWLDYNRSFGRADVVQSIFNHVNGMARDIAAMEILGPNPGAMVEYLKQVVAHEIGKKEAGLPNLSGEAKLFKHSQARLAEHRIDSLYQALRGRPTVVSGIAEASGSIKNALNGVLLGTTVIQAAATDPFIARASRKLAGLPATATIGKMIATIGKQNRRDIYRSGIIWEEYLHVMNDELRFAGPAVGAEWSRWIADRGVTWSGLQPLTVGRKLVEARAWQQHIADMSEKTFAQLDPRFRTALEGFGVAPDHWEIWRQSVDPLGFVTQRQIEANGGPVTYLDMSGGALQSAAHMAEAKALAHREAADKLSEVINSWSERAVPAGTPNTRSAVTGLVPRGTVAGEMLDYFMQFKSFGFSFTAMQLEAMAEMAATRGGGKGRRSGLAYFAAMAVPLTLGGAVYLQVKSLLDGKQPEDMNPLTNKAFWVKAGLASGGFGLFGDFVKATENRFGQSLWQSIQGPVPAFIGDTLGLTIGNVYAKSIGAKVNIGRDVTDYLRRYTPFVASNWLTRGVFNRLVMDNLQWALDPAADKSFKSRIGLAKKAGTPYFVKPGQFTPMRR